MKGKEIKVEVKFTDGYERRFTEACLKQISKRSKAESESDGDGEKKTA